jgi:hypothetical protein
MVPQILYYWLVEKREIVDDPQNTVYLARFPWSARSKSAYRPHDLVKYLGKDWMGADGLDNAVATANKILSMDPSTQSFEFAVMDTSLKILTDFRKGEVPRNNRWPGTYREKLKTGECKRLGMCFNVNTVTGLPTKERPGNHWIGVVINPETKEILIGDSLPGTPLHGVLSTLKEWLALSFGPTPTFTHGHLPSRVQRDYWSCGDHAFAMVAHHLAPQSFAPFPDGLDSFTHRIQLLEKILEYIHVQ